MSSVLRERVSRVMLVILVCYALPVCAATNTYTVQPGDTLYRIAKAHGMTVNDLVELNDLANASVLRPGQKLILEARAIEKADKPSSTLVRTYTVQAGDTIWAIGRKTGIHPTEILRINNLRPDSIVHPGLILYLADIREVFPVTPQSEPRSDPVAAGREESSSQPIGEAAVPISAPPLPTPQPHVFVGLGGAMVSAPLLEEVKTSDRLREGQTTEAGNADRLIWPVVGQVSSRFGRRWGRVHQGIDICAPIGTPVRAAAAGMVTFAGFWHDYGLLVIIDHGAGWETYYAHNDDTCVLVGGTVHGEQVIAKVGASGNATGPHVHFEIRKNGSPLDPLRFLN